MYKCPQCNSSKDLGISGMIYVSAQVDKDGNVISDITQDLGSADMEWDSDCAMYCNVCDFDGRVPDFDF